MMLGASLSRAFSSRLASSTPKSMRSERSDVSSVATFSDTEDEYNETHEMYARVAREELAKLTTEVLDESLASENVDMNMQDDKSDSLSESEEIDEVDSLEPDKAKIKALEKHILEKKSTKQRFSVVKEEDDGEDEDEDEGN